MFVLLCFHLFMVLMFSSSLMLETFVKISAAMN